jgi:hypothetical protein
MYSSCNYFVSRIAGETRKAYTERWNALYDEVVERYPLAWEARTKDGFEVVEAGRQVAYFSLHGIDFE